MIAPRALDEPGALAVRLACGHLGRDDECETCRLLGESPDPWVAAGGDVSPNREAES